MPKTPEELVDALYCRIVSPRTGEFETRGPARHEIVAAVRAAMTARVEDLLAAMTPEERVAVFSGLDTYCQHCGVDEVVRGRPCYCVNDD